MDKGEDRALSAEKLPKFPEPILPDRPVFELWRRIVAEKLEELIKTKSFDHYIGHVGLAEGKYRVIGVEWLEKVLSCLKGENNKP